MNMDSFELKAEDLEKVIGGMEQQQRTSGIECPNCKGFIPISMMQIITASSIFCPACGLRLDLDNAKSQKAIEALKRLEEAQRGLGTKNQ